MNIDFFRKQILRLREYYKDISDVRANHLWKEFSEVDEGWFLTICHKYVFESRFLKVSDAFEKDLRELIKNKTPPTSPPSTSELEATEAVLPLVGRVEKVSAPMKTSLKYCCEKGAIYTRYKLDGGIYVWKCDCGYGTKLNQRWPTWDFRFLDEHEKL